MDQQQDQQQISSNNSSSSSSSSINCCCSCGGGGGGGSGTRKGVKVPLHLIKHNAKMPCKGVEVQLHAFSTTVLDGTKYLVSCLDCYIPILLEGG